MRGLAGRTALVTGGASGIGAATALRLAEEGAHVIVADLDVEGARVVAKEIEGVALHMDVTDETSVGAVGPVDVLVNNAGTGRFAMFVDSEPDTWEREWAVNVRGTMSCTGAMFEGMVERRRGTIVNVASMSGVIGTTAGASYSAAKAGVIGFTKAIAREGARYGIRCNAVAPGPVDTPLLEVSAEAFGPPGAALRQGMIDATVLRRLAQPEEVAAAIAFLASDDSSYITGHTLHVSGGMAMT